MTQYQKERLIGLTSILYLSLQNYSIVTMAKTSIYDVNAKATITWCDLSARFFCIDATLLCEFESDKIWINEFE